MKKDLFNSFGSGAAKTALLGGTALALVLSAPAGAYAEKPSERDMEQRVQDLERELRLLRNQRERRAREAADEEKIVTSGSSKVKLKVSGQVNRAFVAAFSTGKEGSVNVLSVDNDNSSSRLIFDGNTKTGGWKIRARISFELQDNPSDNTSTITDGDTAGIGIRKVEIRFKHDTWGAIWIGQGDSATDDIAESDLSGTTVIANSDVKDTFGGIEHEDNNDSTAFQDERRGDDIFNNLDGNSRQNRIRYDTPTLFNVVKISFSFDEENSPAIGIFGAWDPQGWKIRISGGWTHRPRGQAIAGGVVRDGNEFDAGFNNANNSHNLYAGSFSILHTGSGISFTVAGGTEVSNGASGPDPWYIYFKLGYRVDIFQMGETRFSVDYIRSDNFRGASFANNSTGHAWSVRFAVVQKIDEAGTELYFAYGYQDYYEPFDDFQPFHALIMGARVKF